jgi:hypothetical protein
MRQNETILAVNTFDERRFIYDPREKFYFSKNEEAITDRKVIIHRIFIYDDTQQDADVTKEKLSAIKMNYDAKIVVLIVYKSKMNGLKNVNELYEDTVIFAHNYPRLYIYYPDKFDPMRISHGVLRINASDIEQFKRNFNTLKNMAISKEDMGKLFKEKGL